MDLSFISSYYMPSSQAFIVLPAGRSNHPLLRCIFTDFIYCRSATAQTITQERTFRCFATAQIPEESLDEIPYEFLQNS
jgi:hypothetical protein